MTIWISAAEKVMVLHVGAAAGTPPAKAGLRLAGTMMSRYIFQHTHNSRMPPASARPTIASSCVATSANRMRSTTAPPTPQKMTLARRRGSTLRGRHADHDGVVAGEHDVDEDDLHERDQLLRIVQGVHLLRSSSATACSGSPNSAAQRPSSVEWRRRSPRRRARRPASGGDAQAISANVAAARIRPAPVTGNTSAAAAEGAPPPAPRRRRPARRQRNGNAVPRAGGTRRSGARDARPWATSRVGCPAIEHRRQLCYDSA